ncbi:MULTISPECIES: FAD-binding oxidoreductase [unclassified Paenibacillus]|uniref:FAD-binding oxidoreductase n=1 Tax=unclassified Paenibacillus TaxID=185978 RepID=UPI001AE584C6|nr:MULTISPECIES: FAD-binding oxidoreductase [unclassified Paenibacillus]MBP1155760.1 glycolate oxidase FAD binding subunit [Paenibacillus sp. PvP091]MBP1168854.1 glycolate oxidase FAD binding subunit [Paenibacillus sp. PvR098]MBP2439882.1 glycolate oxidase FAD binding subunit [Paenibacillus sp. PvP052]
MNKPEAVGPDLHLLAQSCVVTECSDEMKKSLGLSYDAELPIAEPGSEAEVSEILRNAQERGLAVIPTGLGSQLFIGENPQRTDILLSSRQLTGIVEHSVGDLTMTVRAGTPYSEIQSYLREHGQFIPIMPPTADESTIGGLIGTAASGPERVLYGSWRDNVIGLRVVYPNGNIIRTGGKVVKNVAGYDMNKLFVGSHGSLGFISEVTLRVRPYPKHREMILAHSKRLEDLTALAAWVLASECIPSWLELTNRPSEGLYELAIGCDEVESAARYQAERIRQLASAMDSQVDYVHLIHEEMEQYGLEHRTEWKQTAPDSLLLKAACPIPSMTDLLSLFEREASSRNVSLDYTASLGVGTLRIRLRSNDPSALVETAQLLRQSSEQRGGYLVLEYGEESLKKDIGVWGTMQSGLSIMKGIKQTIDPACILSPGRFVGGC